TSHSTPWQRSAISTNTTWRLHIKKISRCQPLNISTATAVVKPKFYWKQPTTPLRKLPKSMAFLHNLSSHKHSNAKPTQPPPNIVEQGAGLRVPDVERKAERRRVHRPGLDGITRECQTQPNLLGQWPCLPVPRLDSRSFIGIELIQQLMRLDIHKRHRTVSFL